VIRVVPRVDREEFVNVGVILSCPSREFLEARVHVDAARLSALDAALDVAVIEQHLASFPRICRGGADAGPPGAVPPRPRVPRGVSPRSAQIQTSPVHSGLSDDPAATLEHLLRKMVLQNAQGTEQAP
jgi:hypothetical protein